MTATVKPRGTFTSRRRLMIAAAVIVAALVFLVFQGLGNATVYFKTADEAVAQKAKLGNHRFRIEGVVVPASLRTLGDNSVAFTITSKGVSVPVVHHGDEPPLFEKQQTPPPVVLEGRFEGDTFASDRIIVKHSETYTEQHPDRVAGTANQP
jgi:cytochrome c-type biogenesis protein CcmE